MSSPKRDAGTRSLKSTAVAASLTLTLAGALTACGGGGSSAKSGHAEICVDKARGVRVAEALCVGRTDPNLAWYYTPAKCGQTVQPFTGMALTPGQGSYERPRKGKIERGGFGTCKSKSSS